MFPDPGYPPADAQHGCGEMYVQSVHTHLQGNTQELTLGRWNFEELSQYLSRGYPDFPRAGTGVLPTVQMFPSHAQHIPRNPTLVGVTL